MSNSTGEPPSEQSTLFDELRKGQIDLVKTIGPAMVITLIGFVIAYFFVEPAPPRKLVIATGNEQGDYYATAKAYAETFRRNGIELEIRETAGTIENYELLLNDSSVHLAIVQGGAVNANADSGRLESLGSLYLEPVWIFHRAPFKPKRLGDFVGRKIAVGENGSGTQTLANLLLRENGLESGVNETEMVYQGGRKAVAMLHAGEVDAVFLVLTPRSPLIAELLESTEINLFEFERSAAYARRFQFLEQVILEQGVVDLQKDLPDHRIQLVAPYANLVATHELHDAFIPLLLEAATATHETGGLLVDSGALPSLAGAEFPNSAVARQYVEQGPSFFQRHLSFWVASLIDRAKIMLIPLIALLIPLVKLAPPMYRWRIRSRIYRWYAILRGIDQKLRDEDDEGLEMFVRKLSDMEQELSSIAVPLSYMEEFYNLRMHIDLIKRRLQEVRDE